MAQPSEKLVASLIILKKLQDEGKRAIRSSDLTRIHRERLVKAGFLQEILRGWYVPSRPDDLPGDSTAWYVSFWHFCASYLRDRFGTEWCLSPEQSLSLQAGNKTIPRQLLIRSPKARNQITKFPYNTSLLEVRAALPADNQIVELEELRLFSPAAALVACPTTFFIQNPTDTRTILSLIRDASDVLRPLLDGGHSVIAGRLAGAFRNIGRPQIADEIIRTMHIAGYDVRENDPFTTQSSPTLSREQSPYVNRIRLMWETLRKPICEIMPPSPGLLNSKTYLKQVEEAYTTDAYHSLSIEGYQVSPQLLERVQQGTWNPDNHEYDRNQRNALAARGYWQAFQAVKESVQKVLKGENPGLIAAQNHGVWYQKLFEPNVQANLLKASDLSGYRNAPVYIRRSMHVPPNCEAVRDLMPAFFDLLRDEPEASVRAVLGHFIFVYIHPYMDGNGRLGRFLMNVMMASGGYPWTIIRVENRDIYMSALEKASVDLDIRPLAEFIAKSLSESAFK